MEATTKKHTSSTCKRVRKTWDDLVRVQANEFYRLVELFMLVLKCLFASMNASDLRLIASANRREEREAEGYDPLQNQGIHGSRREVEKPPQQ